MARTRWGERYRVALVTLMFLAAYLGFEAIVCYEDAYGTVYEDALDLFFAVYCVLLPVRTAQAALAGVAMVAMSLAGQGLCTHSLPPEFSLWLFYNAIILAVFVYCRYITNRQWESEFNARQSLQQALRQYREALAAKQQAEERMRHAERMAAIGRLTGELAHELNNPLTTIAFNLTPIERELEAHPETPETVRAAVQNSLALVREGLERTVAVIRNLRKFGTLVRKDNALLDVNAILETSAALMAELAHRSAIDIHRHYGNVPKTWCNGASLSHVFVNVLRNACEAVGRSGNIWIRSRLEGNDIEIAISNDGPAVPLEALAHVFETDFTTKGSSGLGLAISRRIIEEQGGTIALENASPGIAVTIRLPVRPG